MPSSIVLFECNQSITVGNLQTSLMDKFLKTHGQMSPFGLITFFFYYNRHLPF